MGLFEEQIARKPNKYPWTEKFIEVTQAGFWTHREFSFQSDIQDFKVNLTDQEKQVIIRSLSVIGQVEIAVKMFWGNIGKSLPHPSLIDLGFVLANTEVIHGNAYERLLEVLGIEDSFDEILNLKIIKNRVSYLKKHLDHYSFNDRQQFIYSLILFTLFIENLSLFSQFYTISWFNKNKNLLKDTNKQIEYTAREEQCFIDGTEVLTPNGWRKISTLKVDDYVIQYNKNQTLEYTKVLKVIEKDYVGKMYEFSRKGQKCVVTPEHEMVIFHKKIEYRKIPAWKLKFHKLSFIPISAPLVNGVIKSTENELSFEDRLRIVIQADGTNSYWVSKIRGKILRGVEGGYTHYISIKKQRKIDRLRWILSNLSLEYKEYPIDKKGNIKFSIKYNHDYNYKEFDWVDLLTKSGSWCKQFIEEIVHWDGFITESSRINYSTTDKENLDIVQGIAVLAGYSTTVTPKVDNRSETFSDSWRISFKNSNPLPASHSIDKRIFDYSGKVSCITVESGAIITRYDDKTFIAGNCHTLVGIKLINTLREEYPHLFDTELKEKILKESKNAVEYECEIVNWILNGINYPDLNPITVRDFLMNRLNWALNEIGYGMPFVTNEEEIKKTVWFDELLNSNAMTDFFNSKPTEYSQKSKSFTELF